MFDPQSFLDATFTEANDTQMVPVPAGEFSAMIDDIKFINGQKKDGSGTWTKLQVKWTVQDASVSELLGRVPSTFQDIFLDTLESGGLDMGKGKNIGLGRLREATDTNRAGEAFSPRMLIGRSAKVKIEQEPYQDKILSKVTAVSRQA